MTKRVLGVLAVVLGAACSSSSATTTTTPTNDADAGVDAGDAGSEVADVELLAFVDLPRQDTTQGLSGTFYDEAARTLWAIQDTGPSLVPLVHDPGDFTTFTTGPAITLTGRSTTRWDGEGLTVLNGDFVAVTDETAPLVERFDKTGKFLATVDLPAHYANQASGNKGIESLSLSPSAKYLFASNEGALTSDGTLSTKTQGTIVRILRRDLAAGKDEEHAYRTEPLGDGTGGDMGVSDVTAIDDTNVLVLERGFQAGYGNTVRIFRADVSSSPDVSTTASLDASTTVLAKKLVVDIGKLPPSGATHPATQPNPLLDNYEALALGPVLPDGRRIVFVTSDDNASAEQVARILVLAVKL